jgi:hypothetical protein
MKLGDLIKLAKSKKKIDFKGVTLEEVFDFIVSLNDKEMGPQPEYTLGKLLSMNKYKFSEENLLDDTSILDEYPNNDLLIINSIYLRNTAEYYTCPGKTMIIYTMDDLNFSEADKGFLDYFMCCYDKKFLRGLITNNKALFDLKNHIFHNYEGIELDSIYQKSLGMNLRVIMWVTLKKTDHHIINLKPFYHIGKYVVIRFIDKYVKTISGAGGNNMDFSKVHFFGTCIKMSN